MEIREKTSSNIVGIISVFFVLWLVNTQVKNLFIITVLLVLGLLLISKFRRKISFKDNEILVEFLYVKWNKSIPYSNVKKISYKKGGSMEYRGTVISFFYINDKGYQKVLKFKVDNSNELLYIKSFINNTFGGTKDFKNENGE